MQSQGPNEKEYGSLEEKQNTSEIRALIGCFSSANNYSNCGSILIVIQTSFNTKFISVCVLCLRRKTLKTKRPGLRETNAPPPSWFYKFSKISEDKQNFTGFLVMS